MRPASMTRVPALRMRSGSTRSAPERTIMPSLGLGPWAFGRPWSIVPGDQGLRPKARGPLLVALPVGVHVQLATVERQRRPRIVAVEENAIDALDEREQLPFVGRL